MPKQTGQPKTTTTTIKTNKRKKKEKKSSNYCGASTCVAKLNSRTALELKVLVDPGKKINFVVKKDI